MSRILLVEDDQDNFDLVRFLLERDGHVVLAARNGKQALDIARKDLPDLILMDLSLPEISGWEAARLLKADEATRTIPLLAITAHTLPGDRKQTLEYGFNGFISKPINVQDFPAEIKKALTG